MTLKEATKTLSTVGVSLKKQDGEYRVALRSARDPEASAYYTDHLDDAVSTGLLMASAPRGKHRR